MFSNAVLYYLFDNFIELVYAISMRAQYDLDSNTIVGTYTSIQFYAIYTISDIIFTFISILLAYVVLFKFHDRVIEFLGADGESGIGGSTQASCLITCKAKCLKSKITAYSISPKFL